MFCHNSFGLIVVHLVYVLGVVGAISEFSNKAIYPTAFSGKCQLTYDDVQAKLENRVEEFVNLLGGTNSRYDISYGSRRIMIQHGQGFGSIRLIFDSLACVLLTSRLHGWETTVHS